VTAFRWVVSGRVQGVGFRWFIVRRAEELDLHGWVSNLPDGRVEIVASGTTASLEVIDDVAREGPEWAIVDNVEKLDYPHEVDERKPFSAR
jgi:acylphosphatase